MNKKYVVLTSANYLICLSIIAWVFFASVSRDVQAYQPPAPFLGPVYYGEETILKVFDHELPLFSPADDGNTFTRHYDGTPYPNGSDPYYGYDQHLGIDYNLKYEPVLAAANGQVQYAGWSEPASHQKGYGLHVRMNHTANSDYRAWYGHLSTVTVETGATVVANPATRDGIIGISGNTGSVSLFGACPPVYLDPTCNPHLHFEVRRISGNKPVNPYGWIGTIPDPWANYAPTATPPAPPGTPVPSGATSYNLWTSYPARPDTPAQYPDGPTIATPTVPVAVLTIDDNDEDEYSTYPTDCMVESSAGGINGGYDYTLTIGFPDAETIDPCTATWYVNPSGSLTPSGMYDVYVHIPGLIIPGSLGALYDVTHSGETHTAIVAQAAYPNSDHPAHWVYIGRYEFEMTGGPNERFDEYIRMSNTTFEDDDSHIIAADAIQLAHVGGPAVTATPTVPVTPTPSTTPRMTIPINQSSDDAGHRAETSYPCSTTTPNYGTTWLEIYIGHCDDGANIVSGFGFTNVTVPPSAIITRARIEFTQDYEYTEPINVQFRGQKVVNSLTFNSTNRPDNLTPLTDAFVLWNINEPWVGGFDTRYNPDIKRVVQEIVSQPLWQSGYNLTIIVQPQPGMPSDAHRRVFAFDRPPTPSPNRAKLQIWYATPLNTGYISATANQAEATGDGNGFEVTPVRAYIADDQYAMDMNSGTSLSSSCTAATKDKHRFLNFTGLTIPSGATVAGIEVRLDAKVDSTTGSPRMCVFLSQNGGATWTLAKETPGLQTTEQTPFILGGPTDTWGTVWIPSSFYSSNFRVRIVNVSSSLSSDFSLDWVAVKVYYLP